MTPLTSGAKLTADDLLQLTSGRYRYELIDGELNVLEPSGGEHGYLAMEIGGHLRDHVKRNALGRVLAAETGFILTSNPDTVRAPDACFISHEHLARIGLGQGYLPGAPDLAVEVLSPSDSRLEARRKAFDWLNAGARMVIVVDPAERSAFVYRPPGHVMALCEDDTLDGADVVPGWCLPLRELFE